jgi:PleD family two-component response regulator
MDSLTGVFDYNGFVKHAKPMIERVKSTHQYVGVLAIDVCDIGDINAKKGREAGEKITTKIDHVLDVVSVGLTEEERVAFYKSLAIISEHLEAVSEGREM